VFHRVHAGNHLVTFGYGHFASADRTVKECHRLIDDTLSVPGLLVKNKRLEATTGCNNSYTRSHCSSAYNGKTLNRLHKDSLVQLKT
jgi:hypothetical protein